MKRQTSTLVFEDPKIKPALMKRLVSEFLNIGEVIYLDFDLQFSSTLQNLEVSDFNLGFGKNMVIMQPTNDALDFVSRIASLEMKTGGIMILDSLNTLQNLVAGNRIEGESKIANQRSAVLITVLQRLSRFYAKSLLIVNVAKARQRTGKDNSMYWEKSLVGGRMIKFKSEIVFFANETQDGLPNIEIRAEEKNSNVESQKIFLRF